MIELDWPRIRVLTVAGILILIPLCLVIYLAVTPILRSLDQAQNDAHLVQQLQGLSAQRPSYQAEIRRAKAILADQGAFYVDSSAELASAQLQNTLQGLIAQAGGQIQSSAIIAPQTGHGLQILAVALSLSLPESNLSNFLTSIDINKPYLFVQSIDIRSSEFAAGGQPLDVQMQVSGFSDLP